MSALALEVIQDGPIVRRIRQTTNREDREAQRRAELRLEELIKVDGIADEYERVDRMGDLNIERHFALIYSMAHSDRMRELIAQTYAMWMADEKAEERAVRSKVEDAGTFMRLNNSVWIDGAAVPSGSDGAA